MSVEQSKYPITDVQLAQRLETVEAMANIAFVESHARRDPESGAAHACIGGVHAMFDGPDSPLTQTFGLGVLATLSNVKFDALEQFFLCRSAPVFHEVSSLADPDLLRQLGDRGYLPIEVSTVLVRPTSIPLARKSELKVRAVLPDEGALWSRTAGEGWSSVSAELASFMEGFGGILTAAQGVQCFLAEIEGRPIAAGAVCVHEDVALLAGASTIQAYRRQGAQLALLAARLKYAVTQGANLAMVVAQPGSASQRNAERQGFRTAYTRTKWRLRQGSA